MTRIIHLPGDRGSDPLWINLDNLTAVRAVGALGKMSLWFTGYDQPTLYLTAPQSAYFREYLELLALPSVDPSPDGGISDADYFDHHTAAAAEGGSDGN